MADLESAHKNLIECGDVENVGTGKAVIASLCVYMHAHWEQVVVGQEFILLLLLPCSTHVQLTFVN
jgi:hypothetical protein